MAGADPLSVAYDNLLKASNAKEEPRLWKDSAIDCACMGWVREVWCYVFFCSPPSSSLRPSSLLLPLLIFSDARQGDRRIGFDKREWLRCGSSHANVLGKRR